MEKCNPTVWFLLCLLLTALALGACKTEKPPEGEQAIQTTEAKDETQTIILAIPTLDCSLCTAQLELPYTEAFQRLGYHFEGALFPPERALVEANEGRVDGDAVRMRFSANLQNQYPNLIRVDETIQESIISAYAMHSTIQVQGWESLAGTDLSICYLRGYKVMETNLPQYVSEENLVGATDLRLALRMLVAGRIDVYISFPKEMQGALEDDEFKDAGIQRIGDVDSILFYPYLHKKHAELVPQLAAVLRAMKEDGTYDRLMEQAEQQVKDSQQ